MILRQIVVGMFASNCFIVGSDATREGMIIDPGADSKAILEAVSDSGLSIGLIVATHNHPDHIGALAQVKEKLGAKYAIHEADSNNSMPSMVGRVVGAVMSGSLKSTPGPDRLLNDGDVIEVGDLKFTVVHTPGHTRGGISLVGDGVVFSGDTLFNLGIGRTDMPGGDYGTLMDSIAKKLMALPDETVVYPGHGPRTTIGVERKRNPFL
jgi:glyoxylase-like metal-dependent hydrolase (beta-lactamase superfamily II)